MSTAVVGGISCHSVAVAPNTFKTRKAEGRLLVSAIRLPSFQLRGTFQTYHATNGKTPRAALTRTTPRASQPDAMVESAVRRATGANSPPLREVFFSLIGAVASISALLYADRRMAARGMVGLLLGSFGATVTILMTMPSSAPAQPWNLIVGHIVSGLVSVLIFKLMGATLLAKSVGVALAIAFMLFTNSLHPPAAGLPLIFMDSAKWHSMNWWFAIYPAVPAVALLMLLQGCVLFVKNKTE